MRIQNNVQAFNAFRNLSNSQNQLGKSLEKLSSGYRINRAADDAAGLVTSENLRAKIGGLQVASRNAQDGISVVQTAEGALTEVHSILGRMRDLAVQAANTGGNTTTAVAAAQDEIVELTAELDRIFTSTKYGDKTLFDGAADTDFDFQVGADSGDQISLTVAQAAVGAANLFGAYSTSSTREFTGSGETIATGESITIQTASGSTTVTQGTTQTAAGFVAEINSAVGSEVTATYNATTNKIDIVSDSTATTSGFSITADPDGIFGATGAATVVDVASDASTAIDDIDDAIGAISGLRGQLGAFQNRMESTIRNLGVATENLTAAESRIRDADMALETVSFTKNQVLQQAGVAMLAQANVAPQSVLRLLG